MPSPPYGLKINVSRVSLKAQFRERPYYHHDVVRAARREFERRVAQRHPGYAAVDVRTLDVDDKGAHYEVGFIYGIRWKGHYDEQ